MKINWGHKLAFFIILFMAYILFMVYKLNKQSVDLVDKNYYEKGVRYQEEINKYDLAKSVNANILFDVSNKTIQFSANTKIKGNVNFYRPSNSSDDFSVPFETDTLNRFSLNTDNTKKGNWKVIFEWKHNNVLMATEKQILLQ